jgi:hypothetical protein
VGNQLTVVPSAGAQAHPAEVIFDCTRRNSQMASDLLAGQALGRQL